MFLRSVDSTPYLQKVADVFHSLARLDSQEATPLIETFHKNRNDITEDKMIYEASWNDLSMVSPSFAKSSRDFQTKIFSDILDVMKKMGPFRSSLVKKAQTIFDKLNKAAVVLLGNIANHTCPGIGLFLSECPQLTLCRQTNNFYLMDATGMIFSQGMSSNRMMFSSDEEKIVVLKTKTQNQAAYGVAGLLLQKQYVTHEGIPTLPVARALGDEGQERIEELIQQHDPKAKVVFYNRIAMDNV